MQQAIVAWSAFAPDHRHLREQGGAGLAPVCEAWQPGAMTGAGRRDEASHEHERF